MKQILEKNYLKEHVTLEQFQRIYALSFKATQHGLEHEENSELVKIAYNLTDNELESMQLGHYTTLKRQLADFLFTCPETPAKRYIKAAGRWYYIELDPEQLPVASVLALTKYLPKKQQDLIETLHYLTARLVRPVKMVMGFPIRGNHEQAKVEVYGESLKQARFIDIMAVWQYFQRGWIQYTKDSVQKHHDEIRTKCRQQGLSDDEIDNLLHTATNY